MPNPWGDQIANTVSMCGRWPVEVQGQTEELLWDHKILCNWGGWCGQFHWQTGQMQEEECERSVSRAPSVDNRCWQTRSVWSVHADQHGVSLLVWPHSQRLRLLSEWRGGVRGSDAPVVHQQRGGAGVGVSGCPRPPLDPVHHRVPLLLEHLQDRLCLVCGGRGPVWTWSWHWTRVWARVQVLGPQWLLLLRLCARQLPTHQPLRQRGRVQVWRQVRAG